MKKCFIILGFFLCISNLNHAQELNNLDEITPYHENYAAIRKGDSWAFINDIGAIKINFRDDVVGDLRYNYAKNTIKEKITYPHFSNDRCLIRTVKDGISYFGYINSSGEVVIKPEFVNATPFYNGYAVVLRVAKEHLGVNNLLAKNVVSYSYDELLIDKDGKVLMHLGGPEHLILSKEKLRNPPPINAYFITENLIAVKNDKNAWEIRSL